MGTIQRATVDKMNPFRKLKGLIIRKYLERSIEPSLAVLLERGRAMKGWRTLAFNGGIAAVVGLLTWVAG